MDKPNKIYRGIVLNAAELSKFDFSQPLTVPYEPIIDARGRKTVMDGNEYGVYCTDNEIMADQVYGNPNHGGENIYNKIRIGQRVGVTVGEIGMTFTINTNQIDIREPWITQVLRGHYNNGYQGKEWIADSIPSKDFDISQMTVGKDVLHGEQQVDLSQGVENAKQTSLAIVAARRERVEALLVELKKMSFNQINDLDCNLSMGRGQVLRKIFGESGAREQNLSEVDTQTDSGRLKHMFTQTYQDNREDINYKMLDIINDIGNRIKDAKEPITLSDCISSLINAAHQRKELFIEKQRQQGKEPNLDNHNATIERLEQIAAMNLSFAKTKEIASSDDIGDNRY